MPRIPRSLTLEEGYQTHKMWKTHNGETSLKSRVDKVAYLNYLNRYLPKQSNKLNAFCNMSNHSHEIYDINNVKEFSNLMRDHHARNGYSFNRRHKRYGKVAYERPKTCLIESDEYSMQATLYIHANPVKAGIVKNAANYAFSTHRLYAFGKRDKYTKHVMFPQWYMDLGKTPSLRQKRYRRLFDAYLREKGLITLSLYDRSFLGSYFWSESRKNKVTNWIKTKHKSPP